MPMIIASAVISTGRSRVVPADSAALCGIVPLVPLVVGEGDQQDAVGRGHADAHDRPHQRRHADRRLRDEQHPQDAGQRAGQGHEDDERIEPRLEIHDHQEIDEQHGEDQAERQPAERVVHALDLAADGERAAARQLRPQRVNDPLHVGRHASQVAPLHVGVDLEHRLHVVVAHDRLRDGAVQVRHVAQQLRLLLRCCPGICCPGARPRRPGDERGQVGRRHRRLAGRAMPLMIGVLIRASTVGMRSGGVCTAST